MENNHYLTDPHGLFKLPQTLQNDPNTTIVVDDTSEGFLYTYFEKIHKLKYRGKILYQSANLNGAEIYHQWCKQNDCIAKMQVVYKNSHFESIRSFYKHNDIKLHRNYKSKWFCNLNNRQHEHRCEALAYLYNLNLIDKGIVSFRSLKKDTHTNFVQRCKNSPLSKEILQDTEKLLPLHVDHVESTNPMDYSKPNDFNLKIYSALINLTSETFYDEPGLFLSEKTWKPILAGQMFIIIGQKYTLKRLRDLGFETFGHILDESYDNMDNDKRMYAAIDQLDILLKKYTLKQLNKFTHKIRKRNFELAIDLVQDV